MMACKRIKENTLYTKGTKTFGMDVWNEYLTFSFVRNSAIFISQYQWRRAKGERDVAKT